jgi:hypothetical protein
MPEHPTSEGSAMSDAPRDAEGTAPAPLATDLVEYLIVVVSDLPSLASVAHALAGLADTKTIRVLDVVVLVTDGDGAVEVLELEAVESLAPLRDVDGDVGGFLTTHDIELASMALGPDSTGLLVVTEDRWAEPLSSAARQAGGRIVAGERIAAARVESVLSRRRAWGQQEV